HCSLGGVLPDKGDVDGAIAACREAIRLKKDLAAAHYNLGNALRYKGDMDGAIAAYREAIRLKKGYAEAHCNLRGALRDNGQFGEALTYFCRGHELGSKSPQWRYPSAQWIKACERLIELDGKLPAILSGTKQPANAIERTEYAEVCRMKRLYASAARLYQEAIPASRDVVKSPVNGRRYDAGCAAALAGCGTGEDAAKLTDADRAALRKQALAWLRADLDAWVGRLNADPGKAGPVVAKQMQLW